MRMVFYRSDGEIGKLRLNYCGQLRIAWDKIPQVEPERRKNHLIRRLTRRKKFRPEMRLKSQIINKASPRSKLSNIQFSVSYDFSGPRTRRVHVEQEEGWDFSVNLCFASVVKSRERWRRTKKTFYYNLMLIRTPKKFSCLWTTISDVERRAIPYQEKGFNRRSKRDPIVFRRFYVLHIFFIIKNLK